MCESETWDPSCSASNFFPQFFHLQLTVSSESESVEESAFLFSADVVVSPVGGREVVVAAVGGRRVPRIACCAGGGQAVQIWVQQLGSVGTMDVTARVLLTRHSWQLGMSGTAATAQAGSVQGWALEIAQVGSRQVESVQGVAVMVVGAGVGKQEGQSSGSVQAAQSWSSPLVLVR